MTHEQSAGRPLPPAYELPVDPMMAEFNAVESFSTRFPEEAPLMSQALHELHNRLGSVPSTTEEDDVLGQIARNPSLNIAVVLNMPIEYPADSPGMNEWDKNAAYLRYRGDTAVGGLSTSTHEGALMDGIYSITGATIIRDDRSQGDKRQLVMRKGVFEGKDVYFAETYVDDDPDRSMPAHVAVQMLDEKWAQRKLVELTDSQLDKMERDTGMEGPVLGRFVTRNAVTRENVDAVTGLARAVNVPEEAQHHTEDK